MIKILAIFMLTSQLVFAQSTMNVPDAPEQNTGKSETSLDESPSKKSSDFGVSLFVIGGYQDKQFNNSEPSFDIFDSYIAFSYRINRNFRVSARPAFGYSTEGFDQNGNRVENKARIRDFSFAASINNVMEDYLPATTKLKLKPRLYLPTSDSSKDQGMIARFRPEFEFYYYFNRKMNLKFYGKPSYYFQRNTVYIKPSSDPNRPDRVLTTTLADSEHGAELTYDLNKTFAFKPIVAFEETWSNTSKMNTASQEKRYRETKVFYGIGVQIEPVRNYDFTVSVRTSKDLLNHDRVEETSYSILTDVILF